MTLEACSVTVNGRIASADAHATAGQVTAICGPNGAGKSTLLAALAGLLTPDAGEVVLEGAPLARLAPRERARRIGYLPQAREVAWDIDVATLAALGRLPWAEGEAADRAAVAEALAATDLTVLARRPFSKLSGGEQARALLARVLAGRPRWILADEPLAALDLAHQIALLGHFRALAAGGCGVVVVLHDLAAAVTAADHVVVLDRGRVVAAGPPRATLDANRLRATWGIAGEWAETAHGWALAASAHA